MLLLNGLAKIVTYDDLQAPNLFLREQLPDRGIKTYPNENKTQNLSLAKKSMSQSF
jgi:hypothetical protein